MTCMRVGCNTFMKFGMLPFALRCDRLCAAKHCVCFHAIVSTAVLAPANAKVLVFKHRQITADCVRH